MSLKGVNGSVFKKALLFTTTILLLTGCSSGEEAESEDGEVLTDNSSVVVNNGEDAEEFEPIPERTVVSDKVPVSGTHESFENSNPIEGVTPEDTNNTDSDETYPDLSVSEVVIDEGNPEDVDYNTPYTLYFEDGNGRSVGGQALVSLSTLQEEPELLGEEVAEDTLHEFQLLDTNLINDERGLEDRNKVSITKQAYNRLTELNKNIYHSIDPTELGSSTYVSVSALYVGNDAIPYAINIQAKSPYGDIRYNHNIYNVQEGYTVNYTEGSIAKDGDVGG